jgi:hypothetical protein
MRTVKPSMPSHVRGVHEGNQLGSQKREPGMESGDHEITRGSARRATGINPRSRDPIDPRMPNLAPS